MHVQTHTHRAVSCWVLSYPSQELRDARCQTSVCHQITNIGPLAQSRVPPTPKARASPASGLFHVEREKQGLVLPGKPGLGVREPWMYKLVLTYYAVHTTLSPLQFLQRNLHY